MQDTWMNQQLDTPEKAAAFRQAFHADVYAKALSLTRNENGAAALTDHIFATMEQRFANRVLPMNCLSYLRGQATLIHARLGSELNRLRTESAPVPVQEEPVAPAPKAFRVHRVRKPAAAAVVEPIIVASVVEEAPVAEILPAEELPLEAPAAASVEEQAPEAPAPIAEEQAPEAPAPIVEAATREETIFEEDKTALWMPGESFDMEEHTEAQEAFRAQPKDTSNQRSTKLSIFNTFLFLCAIAATLFLLWELGLLPRLF